MRWASEGERKQLRRMVEKTRTYQGREAITAKLTGPGRLTYLQSVWPDVRVVHVDSRWRGCSAFAAECGFLEVSGWLRTVPWWEGGVSPDELARWQETGSEPGALAALQWRRILETTREEGQALGERYVELHYEDFLAAPESTILALYEQFGLDTARAELPEFSTRNQRYADGWDAEYRQSLIDWMSPVYEEFGYGATRT